MSEKEKKDPEILELSTAKSLHPPIQVKVDGKLYNNRPLSHMLWNELKKHEKDAMGGDADSLFAQVRLIFPIPEGKLEKLDIRDVNTILDFAMAKILSFSASKEAESAEKEAEKNASGPGAKDSG